MKKLTATAIAAFLIVGAASPALAQDFSAPLSGQPEVTAAEGNLTVRREEGALTRAARLGNPAQMINPRAPRELGDGREFVVMDETDPFLAGPTQRRRPIGLRLFAFTF